MACRFCTVFPLAAAICQIAVATAPPYSFINQPSTEYKLPDLPFADGGLEPFIDTATVKVHHQGHHRAYTTKLNAALQAWAAEEERLPALSVKTLLQNLDVLPEKYRTTIINNGGGYVNHNLYWSVMSPNPENKERKPSGKLLEDIEESFGSYESFKEEFTSKAKSLFGSGYVWLSRRLGTSPSLIISTTANQDSPLSEGLVPLLVIDIWEHAYYLKHQNKRPDYINDWWKVVDWDGVDALDGWWAEPQPHEEL